MRLEAEAELGAAYRREMSDLSANYEEALQAALRDLGGLRQGQTLAVRQIASGLVDRVADHLDSAVTRLIAAHFRAGERDADAIALRINTQFVAVAFSSAPGMSLFTKRGVQGASAGRDMAALSARWSGRMGRLSSGLQDRVLVERSKLAPNSVSAPLPSGWPSQYVLLELLGMGGFAKVYSARDVDDNVVAVKLAADEEEARRRAMREMDALKQLSHKNVISLLASADDGSWLVFPRAEITLGSAAIHGRIDGARLLRLVEEVGAGLAHAHERGLIHRDLAPENILSLDSVWVLADWGLAKLPPAAAHSAMTKSGLGTVSWAAPEVLSDPAKADLRADIFSLGRIVGWLVTEEVPEVNRPSVMPDEHAWREFVRTATADARDDRPGDIAHLLALVPKNTALT